MINKKLNIPAVLVHEMDGTLYKLNGMLLSINESAETCTMRFDDDYVLSGIPMNKILINEGFIDKIKEYGLKISSYIVKKVKGFIAAISDEDGNVLPWSLDNVANLAIKSVKGMLPKGVYFAASDSLNSIAGTKTLTVDEAFAESVANDKKMIVDYWTRVMHRAGTTENESIEESIKFVNENYYKTCKLYNTLNEGAIYSYDAVKNKKGYGDFGIPVKSKALKAKLKSNIRELISGPLGGHADVVPMLIWGAPGIGKTAIIKSTISELAKSKMKPINLNLEVIMLAGYTIENWTLPRDASRQIGYGINSDSAEKKAKMFTREGFTDTPKTWLPVYLDCSDPEEKKRRDQFCNACRFLSTDNTGDITSADGMPYEGGIVFMDEYSRVMPNVQNIIMGLGNDHKFGDNYVVASKWGFVFASNRSIDEMEVDSDDKRYYPTPAQSNRFQHFTYEPDKQEWIEWARAVDELTHEANVPPFIVDFIEASPDHVWYSTVVNGGYDDMLNNPENDKQAHLLSSKDAILDVLDQETLKATKRMVTPRTWANTLGSKYKFELKNILDGNTEGITGEEYYKNLIKQSAQEKVDSEGVSYKEYPGGILPDLIVDALNEVDEEYWNEWVEEKGGLELLDPAGSNTGIRGRYNIFMNWFAEAIRDAIGDDSGSSHIDAKSPLMTQWRSYQSYAKHFTPKIFEYIWKHGNMPEEYLKDDDKKPLEVSLYSETEFSKWKGSSTICFEVLHSLFNSYPGNIEEDLKNDIERMENAPDMSDAEAIEEAQKLNAEYTFNINKDKISLLFNDKMYKKHLEILKNCVKWLKYSTVSQNFAHFAMWLSKISIQSEIGNLITTFETKMKDLIDDVDSEYSRIFLNTDKALSASVKARDNKNDKAAVIAYQIEQSKIGLYPAVLILKRAFTYETDKLRDAKKK